MKKETMILKHPLCVRVFHYMLMFSFVPLAVTGLALFLKPFEQATMQSMFDWHIYLGVVLAVACVAFFLFAFDRVVLFVIRVFAVSKKDIAWLLVLGGYPQKFFPFIFKKPVKVPEMGKYNTGQRMFGAAVVIGGTVLVISGLVLWLLPHIAPNGLVYWMGQAHLVAGLVCTAFLPIHLFLGVYFWSDFKAMMTHGQVPYEEAHHHSPLWVENEIVPTIENGERVASKQ